MHIVCTRVTNFYCVPITTISKRIVPIKVPIQEFYEVFTYINVGKFTKWRVKSDYSSISIFPHLFEWLSLM